MSADIPQRNYCRDPLDILLEREARSRKGCCYLSAVVVVGDQREVCDKGRKVGKKCKRYKESD